MNIKFDVPIGEIQEWVIDDIKKELTELHHKDKEISDAHVIFSYHPVAFDGDYVCEIELTIYGSSIAVRRGAGSYNDAARQVMKELTEKVQEQIQKQQENEPPDEIVSTVDVDYPNGDQDN
jgi:hypothetical protein